MSNFDYIVRFRHFIFICFLLLLTERDVAQNLSSRPFIFVDERTSVLEKEYLLSPAASSAYINKLNQEINLSNIPK